MTIKVRRSLFGEVVVYALHGHTIPNELHSAKVEELPSSELIYIGFRSVPNGE